MTIKTTIKAALFASVCLAPLAAVAQDLDLDAAPAPKAAAPVYDNEFDMGLRVNSAGRNGEFGKYNGQTEAGVTGTAGWSLRGRDDGKSGSTRYFNFTGKDIDYKNPGNYMPEAAVDFKIGDQGSWGVNVNYNAITFTQSDNFMTANDKYGNLVNGLSSLVGANTTYSQSSSTIAKYMNTDTVGTRRDIGGLGAKARFQDWTFSTTFQHEHKSGTLENSTVMGTGSPAYNTKTINNAYFPQMVDYDTDRFGVKASYASKRLQGEISYDFSRFRDNVASETIYDAFGSNTRYTGLGLANYSLPPSSWAHQVKGAAGFNITPSTRVMGTVAGGLETRDDSAEIQGGGDTTTFTGGTPNISRTQASARTFFGDVTVTSHPIAGLDLRGSYNMDRRDDLRSLQYIQFALNDSNGQGTTSLYSVPYSWNKQQVKLHAGYAVTRSTKLELDYGFKSMARQSSLSQLEVENTYGAGVRSELGEGFSGRVGVEHSSRWDHDTLFRQNYEGSNPGDVYQAYYQAGRSSDRIKTDLHYSSGDAVNGGINLKYGRNNYYQVDNGRTNDYSLTVGPDLDVQFSKELSSHYFFTYDRFFHNLAGGASSAATPADSAGKTLQGLDSNYTAGASVDWKVADGWKVSGNYVFSFGDTAYTFQSWLPLGSNQPDVTAVMHTLALTSEYEVMPGLSLWGGYSYSRLMVADFANDLAVNTYSNFILPGDTNPNYNVHTVSAMVKTKW